MEIPEDIFPLANQKGADLQHINVSYIRQLAANSKILTQNELETLIIEHHAYLSSGGAGGQWKTIAVNGLVIGFYIGAEGQKGKQTNLERRRLQKELQVQNCQMPFSNCCGMEAQQINFSNGDWSYSLFTDALLNDSDFSNTNLQQSDFSRAQLEGTNFSGANLKGVDFENCNLTGASFVNAELTGARFPGAILKNVVY